MKKTVSELLRLAGAVSPMTALSTARVVKLVNDPNRLVYTELIRDPKVKRVDIEVDSLQDANGWYVTA